MVAGELQIVGFRHHGWSSRFSDADSILESPVAIAGQGRNLIVGHFLHSFPFARHGATRILIRGNRLHQRIHVVLHVGVAIVCHERTVRSIVRIQSVGAFPCIGHSISVGIGRSSTTVQRRPCAPRRRCPRWFVVVLRIDVTTALSTTRVGGFAIARVAHHHVIERIATERGTCIVQHSLVSQCSGVRGCHDVWDGCMEADGVLRGLRISAIAVAGNNLIIDAVCPVVVGHIRILAVDISLHEVFSPQVQRGCISGIFFNVLVVADSYTGYTLSLLVGRCARTRLVVVVDDIHFHALSAIAAIATKIIDDIVAHVHALVELRGETRAQAWCARRMVYEQVVMERGTTTAPVAAIAMRTLRVSTFHQTLSYQAPLHSGILIAQHRQTFVDGPAHRAMVDDDVLLVQCTKAIPSVGTIQQHIHIAQSEAHVTHNHVTALDSARIVGHADAIAWSRLSSDGDITTDVECRLQMNRSRNIEHNNLRSRLPQCPAQRTRTRVIQVADMIHFSTSASRHISTEAFCPRERRLFLCRWRDAVRSSSIHRGRATHQ